MINSDSRCIARTPLVLALIGCATLSTVQAQSLSTLMYFNGSRPAGNVTLGTDGALYGAAVASGSLFGGGASGGLIYRVTPDATQVTTLYQYGNQRGQPGEFLGAVPSGALARDANGNLYGVTTFTTIDPSTGVATGNGTVFRITQSGTYTRLYTFSNYTTTSAPLLNADGGAPVASILLGSDGVLYGSTTAGGANGAGTLFKVGVDGSGFTTLHSFAASSGNNVDARPINTDGINALRLTLATNGDLYGVTASGGANGTGIVFRIRRDGTGFTVLHTFSPSPDTTGGKTNDTGGYPSSGLLQIGNSLYGTTLALGANGYGTLYRIGLDGSGFTVLRSFDLESGGNPSGELILASDGNLVGTTTTGGTSPGAGTLYSITTDGATHRIIYTFTGTNAAAASFGAAPASGIVQASDGSYYGVTSQAGYYNLGTIFKFGPPTNRTPLGNPEPFDEGGALSIGSLVALLSLLIVAQASQRIRKALANS